jgi:hypothetical protein
MLDALHSGKHDDEGDRRPEVFAFPMQAVGHGFFSITAEAGAARPKPVESHAPLPLCTTGTTPVST